MPNIMLQQPQSFLKTADVMLQLCHMILKMGVAVAKGPFGMTQ